ncbi:MAG: nuclear transport factor 2 family protein [Gemmatimonadales bacterium]
MTTSTTTAGQSTKSTVQLYFERLRTRDDWTPLLAESLLFSSRTSPERDIRGRDAYVQATRGFYAMIVDFTLRDLVVDGEKACALTRYRLQPPSGVEFESDVAELFTVSDGEIAALAIYFDTAPYPKRAAQ